MKKLGATGVRVVEPVITAQVVHDYAAGNGVCVGHLPLLRQVTDRETGDAQRLVIRCGSTREAVCAACAEKARRLRMQQCAEGWHLEEEPPRSRRGR
jgi:replication initiator protein RepSA